MKIFISALFVLLSVSAMAQQQDELPYPEEAFSSYFARITRGGKFPGVYLEAPKVVQDAFFKRIKKGSWVGLEDKEKKSLEARSVNLWQDWFQRTTPGPLLFGDQKNFLLASAAYEKLINDGTLTCPIKCPGFSELTTSNWNSLASWKRELFIKTIVLYAPVFGEHTLLWYLAQNYALDENIVRKNVDIKILDHSSFVQAVHDMGYGGMVYFRGITGPDPKDSSRHWILLDDEFLQKHSPFTIALFQQMEIPGILLHELSHVCQDLVGSQLGFSIEVNSAEDALVIEGMAEAYAEDAIVSAGAAMTGINLNPWTLFIREQAVEIVYREGNESSGNLFPYTVGLPFVSSLLDLKTKDSKVETTKKFLQFLDATPLKKGEEKISLSAWLGKF
jgi:hypothetical protein